MADASADIQGLAYSWQRGQNVDPFFMNKAMEMLGGPSIAALGGLPGLSSSATSAATGTQSSTVSAHQVQSSPFILGNDNATGDVGTGATNGGAAAVKEGLNKVTEWLGPAATIVALVVGAIALLKAIKK